MNKQIRITSDSLSPLYKMSVGFDRMAEQFFNDPSFSQNGTGYPPYNITKNKNDIYEITLAIAGFKKSDIEIELEDGTLKITGTSNVLDTFPSWPVFLPRIFLKRKIMNPAIIASRIMSIKPKLLLII